MPQILKTVADYAAALTALLPTGRVWPRAAASASVESQAMTALAPTPQRAAASAQALLTDAFPPTAVELLPEWEQSLGLPDPCAGESPTIALRQSQVAARFSAGGGQSIPYFVSFAKTLGYDITIEQFAPARADALLADAPVYDPAWAFAWQINAPEFTIEYFCADTGNADDPLASWENTVLICEMNRLAPAHTIPLFSYGENTAGSNFSGDFSDDFL